MVQALEGLGLRRRLAVAALAKQREEVFVPGRSEPLLAPGGADSPGLRLLRQCRDEAHAFAVRKAGGERAGRQLGGGGAVRARRGSQRLDWCSPALPPPGVLPSAGTQHRASQVSHVALPDPRKRRFPLAACLKGEFPSSLISRGSKISKRCCDRSWRLATIGNHRVAHSVRFGGFA